jgi:predicted nucleic acid-binding Zn ribbon protein
VSRSCPVCARPLEGRAPSATFCSAACRVAAYRRRKAQRAAVDIVARHDAAMKVLPTLEAWEHLGLFLAVVSPSDDWLRSVA